jgi:hypothetical protein
MHITGKKQLADGLERIFGIRASEFMEAFRTIERDKIHQALKVRVAKFIGRMALAGLKLTGRGALALTKIAARGLHSAFHSFNENAPRIILRTCNALVDISDIGRTRLWRMLRASFSRHQRPRSAPRPARGQRARGYFGHRQDSPLAHMESSWVRQWRGYTRSCDTRCEQKTARCAMFSAVEPLGTFGHAGHMAPPQA